MIRWTTLALVVGLLVAGVLYDRVEQDPNIVAEVPPEVVVAPSIERPSPLEATWFCPVGSTNDGGYAEAEVIITNVGQSPAVANLDVVTDAGPGASLRIDLEGGATEIVPLRSLGSHAAAGAVIEIVGGEGTVAHRLTTATGVTEGMCSSASADRWHVAGGSTTRDARHYLALLNPFPNDVVFEATFQTATRERRPGALETAVVPGRRSRVAVWKVASKTTSLGKGLSRAR